MKYLHQIKKYVTASSLFFKRENSLYILSNVLIAFIGMVRSVYFMKQLDFKSLGFLLIFQTTLVFVSYFQLGLLNGGFRIYCEGDERKNETINNTINTYLLMLIGLASLWFLGNLLIYGLQRDPLFIYFSLLTGIAMISKNWMSNIYIAQGKLGALNRLTVTTQLLSLAAMFSIHIIGFWGALLSLAIPNLLFPVYAFWKDAAFRLTRPEFKIAVIRNIWVYGLIPFIVGIAAQFYVQIERWSIVSFLGLESLGKLYLPFFISGIIVLVPSSVLQIFFPKAIKAYAQDKNAFSAIVRNHLLVLLTYLVIAVLGIWLLLAPVTAWIFPQHLVGIPYCYLILPGIIAIQLCDNLSLIFNTVVKMWPMFWAHVSSLALLFICVLLGRWNHAFSLTFICLVKSFTGIYLLGFQWFAYLYLKRKNKLISMQPAAIQAQTE